MEKDGELWGIWLEKYTARLRLEEQGVDDVKILGDERVTTMNSSNPRFLFSFLTLTRDNIIFCQIFIKPYVVGAHKNRLN